MMTPHREIQERLYDCIVGRLSAQEQHEVEEHCRDCAECLAEFESLRALIEVLPTRAAEPSHERDARFWAEFPDRVRARIERPPVLRSRLWTPWVGEVQSLLTRSWKPVGAAAGILAIAVVAFVLTQRPSPSPAPSPDEALRTSAVAGIPDTTREQFVQYLRKSNLLLVGLTNRKVSDDIIDLSAERDLSRQLVRESRELRESRLDPEASQLVGDMERILIEVASRNEMTDRDHFDLIRSGIRQENLLFKVRMTETVYNTRAAFDERIR